MLSLPDPRAPKEPATPSTRRVPKLSKRCSPAPRGSSDTTRAFGLWRWQSTGELREGAYTQAGLGRDYPEHPGASSRREMAAGQAGDHLPPPPLRKKKKRGDGLVGGGPANPKTWGGGFLGEGWGSPGGLPTLSSFSAGG